MFEGLAFPLEADTLSNTVAFQDAVTQLRNESALSPLLESDTEPDPMVYVAATALRRPFPCLVEAVVINAIRRLRLEHPDDDEDRFVRIVRQNAEDLYHAAQGNNVRLYNYTGFGGILFPAGTDFNTPWGRLRSIAPRETRTFHRRGAPTSVILETVLSSETALSREVDPPSGLVGSDSYFASLARSELLLPLAFALADRAAPAAPVATCSTTLVSFVDCFSHSLRPTWQEWPRYSSSNFSTTEIASAAHWMERLDSQHPPSLDAAANRIVSALTKRRDRTDALIDAVTAWESLVGATPETGFRVTAALTRLLESDVRERKTRHKELRRIYTMRSDIVHGKATKLEEVDAMTDRAIAIAVAALRKLHLDYPHLLPLSSADRCDSIILG